MYEIKFANLVMEGVGTPLKKKQCCGCEACCNICPADAIKMAEDREGFFYPKIDKQKCTGCNLCQKVCPMQEKRVHRAEKELFWGARACSDPIRFSSSSGGIFPLLALAVLEQGGVVYGACLEKGGFVRHIAAADKEQLVLLQKSKYVQSEIGFCFREIKGHLKNGRQVLFSGTPCQCRGLLLYLERSYENLLTVDLICNGVPSPGIWKKYSAYLSKCCGGPVETFSFRDKRNCDRGHTTSFVAGGNEHSCQSYDDLYCRLYFQNKITRPSCHACPFCTPDRESDLTIGDFWGIEKFRPEFEDGMGSSLVIIHSKKGEAAWDSISYQLKAFLCDRDDALQPEQPRLRFPAKPFRRRWIGMILYRLLPFRVWIKLRW